MVGWSLSQACVLGVTAQWNCGLLVSRMVVLLCGGEYGSCLVGWGWGKLLCGGVARVVGALLGPEGTRVVRGSSGGAVPGCHTALLWWGWWCWCGGGGRLFFENYTVDASIFVVK